MPAAQGAVLTRPQWLGCHVGESYPLEEPAVCSDVLVQVGTGLRTLLLSGHRILTSSHCHLEMERELYGQQEHLTVAGLGF